MTLRAVLALFLAHFLTLAVAACSQTGTDTMKGAGTGSSTADSDEAALADLQSSAVWREPRCRWIKEAAWVVAYPQELEVYRAADAAGYIQMTETGTTNRIGVAEPTWRIEMTAAGKAASATCSPATPPDYGVPVSARRFVTARNTGKNYSGDTVFEVDFVWVPTDIGSRLRGVLTGNMTVEEGPASARVSMRSGPGIVSPGPKGWAVMRVDDLTRLPKR